MNATVPASPRISRRRRLFRRVAIVLTATIAVFAAVLIYDDWAAKRAWQAACEEANRLDPGWRWDDLVARLPEVPEGSNSTTVALTARKLKDSMWPTASLKIKAARGVISGPGLVAPPIRLAPGVYEDLCQYLDAISPAVAEALKLADRPVGRLDFPKSPLILQQFDSPFAYLDVVKMLLYPHVLRQLESGDVDGALVTVRAILYTSRPLAEGYTLLNVLVAVAMRYIAAFSVERALAQGEPSLAALDELRRIMETEIDRPLMINAWRGERAMAEDTVRALAEGRLDRQVVLQRGYLAIPGVRSSWTGWSTVDDWINRIVGTGYSLKRSAAHARHTTWMIDALRESPDALVIREEEWVGFKGTLPASGRDSMDHVTRYVTDMRMDEARIRAAAAALAVGQYRRIHGRWPAKLDDLVPKFLTALPRDPQDAKPLRMARVADGIAVYSIGPDGIDDGGDVGLGTIIRGKDIGIRLWDVDKRRQAPLPTPPDIGGLPKL